MVEGIPVSLLARVGEIVGSRLGLGFPEGRHREFVRAVGNNVDGLGYPDAKTFLESVAGGVLGPRELDLLASCVTIGETYFFRHMEQFDMFRDHVLPALIKTRWTNGRRLKIWSAGCSAGEEPYSIAMMTGGLVPDLVGWDITVVGSDVNRQSLKKANEGLFGEWSFRSVPEHIKARFFKKVGDKLEIVPEIRNLVRFSHINLIEQLHPVAHVGMDPVDVIFCRNVLMYFKPETQEQVINSLVRGLSDDGWLIVSPAEAAVVHHPELKAKIFPGVILYSKHKASLSRAPLKPTPNFEALSPETGRQTNSGTGYTNFANGSAGYSTCSSQTFAGIRGALGGYGTYLGKVP